MFIQRNRMLFVIFASLLGMVMGYAILKAADRTPGFYAWRLLSGKAHGGRYAIHDNVQIYFETYGSGEPVLVLHGGFGCLETMHRQIRALAGKHFVIAVDSRGHGRSSDADEPFTYVSLADGVLAVMNELKLAKADVVGWSDGGIIGLDLAMRYPERVRKLVAIGANYDVDGLIAKPASPPAGIPPRSGICARISRQPDNWPVLYERVTKMWQTQPHYSIEDLGKIKSPTLIMAGEFDVISRSHTDQLAEAILHSKLVIVEGGTHSVTDEKASTINEHIIFFLG